MAGDSDQQSVEIEAVSWLHEFPRMFAFITKVPPIRRTSQSAHAATMSAQ